MTRIVRKSGQSLTYELKSPLEIFQTEWKLTNSEIDCLQTYSLRNWTISELLEYTSYADDGIHLTIRLWNVVYSVTLQVSPKTHGMLNYLVHKEHGWRDPMHGETEPKFWLSFREGIWDGQKFAFVIVQEDKGSKKA